MSFDWIDRIDGQDDVLAEDVNSIAHAVIKNQESINKKQNELTFDNTPILGSSNPVTSNGIYIFVKENASGGSASVVVDSELSITSENPVQNKIITEALNGKVDKINGMGLARIGSYGTSYYIAYQDCDDGTAMNIEVYDTAQTDTAISNAIGDVNTALENIIAKYGLGGDVS